jgi:hypothetical protein
MGSGGRIKPGWSIRPLPLILTVLGRMVSSGRGYLDISEVGGKLVVLASCLLCDTGVTVAEVVRIV